MAAGSSPLTAGALDRMLALLDDDREEAAVRYEALRRRTQALFRWWGSDRALELADVTLDRAAVKIEAGAPVPREALAGYVRGIARFVHQESIRERSREDNASRTFPQASGDSVEDGDLVRLENCLETLPTAERSLILGYYGGETRTIVARQTLAGKLGLTATALRIRAHRLRLRLEECLAASKAASKDIQS